jgi:3-vinyl bacteriochlorophyllide hydratase
MKMFALESEPSGMSHRRGGTQEAQAMATHDNRQPPTGDLYTPEQRARRDASRWTLVQGILAPLQFLVFLISLVLVVNYLHNGTGFEATTASIVAKTMVLYAIMVTGALWEKEVFGCYLFAEPFYWEDVVSMLVIALHTAYLASWMFDLLPAQSQIWLALAAYASYLVNAGQFLIKFQMAGADRKRASAAAESAAPLLGAAK